MLAEKQDQEFDASTLAEEALKEAGNDVLKAAELMESWCRSNMGAWKAVTNGLLRTACYDRCASLVRAERRQIYFAPNYDKGGNGDRIVEHARSLFDWPLPGGMRLGDASHADLIKASEFYAKQAKQMHSIATWLNSIAERVGKGKVKNKLTLSELETLKPRD